MLQSWVWLHSASMVQGTQAPVATVQTDLPVSFAISVALATAAKSAIAGDKAFALALNVICARLADASGRVTDGERGICSEALLVELLAGAAGGRILVADEPSNSHRDTLWCLP